MADSDLPNHVREISKASEALFREIAAFVHDKRGELRTRCENPLVIDNIILQALHMITAAHIEFMLRASRDELDETDETRKLSMGIQRDLGEAVRGIFARHLPDGCSTFLVELTRKKEEA